MKRAQSFLLDLMLAFLLVTVTGFILLSMTFVQDNNNRVIRDATTVSGAIFFPYPDDWNSTTVITPGFVQNHRLSAALLDEFINLSYNTTRNLMGVASEFHINVTSPTHNVTYGILAPADVDQIAIINRYAAFNASIAQIEVTTWDD